MSETVPLRESELPDFSGRSVLDIGAWDGYYSFLAERLGASRVVALDHYVWGVDIPKRSEYWAECSKNGTLPDHSRDLVDFWNPSLPGRAGFDFAKEVLNSKVEPVVGDYMTMDLEALGTFDIVLYLGVLYHMKEPLTALERVRRLTREVSVVESAAVEIRGHEDTDLVWFSPGNELSSDYGNWYMFSLKALHGACRAAGFGEVKTIRGPAARQPRPLKERIRERLRPLPSVEYYRATVHAHV
ncbi:MAG TPA: DUF1698 domain-containing protein [Acidimicrobiales bacterium]|nr:DUF1698 domain-containing protein [Acidimicrobiales bacterium]